MQPTTQSLIDNDNN